MTAGWFLLFTLPIWWAVWVMIREARRLHATPAEQRWPVPWPVFFCYAAGLLGLFVFGVSLMARGFGWR